MDGPYKVLEDDRCPGLFSLHGPVGRMKSAMDQDDLLENADEFNEARRLAIEEAIGVVEKLFDEYDLKGGPLDRESGACAKAIERLRALAGQETKEKP